LRISEILFYLSPRSSVLSRGTHWVSWQSTKSSKDNLQTLFLGSIAGHVQIPEAFAGHLWPLDRICLGLTEFPSLRTCPAPLSDSREFCWIYRPLDQTCPVKQLFSATKSLTQICPTGSLDSRGIYRICLTLGPDMSR
jgi:hypothetical protein